MAAHGRERARAGRCVIAHQRGIRVRPRRWEASRRWWGICRAVARLLGPVRVPFNEGLGAARRRPRCGSLLAGLLFLVLIKFGHDLLPLWVGWHVQARPSMGSLTRATRTRQERGRSEGSARKRSTA